VTIWKQIPEIEANDDQHVVADTWIEFGFTEQSLKNFVLDAFG